MRKLTFFLIALFTMQVVLGQEKKEDKTPGPEITIEEASHDFGDITQGEKVSAKFKLKNTGDQPLILQNVLVTCGCTATKWPREPIEAGKTGEIEVSFNSTGKMGQQNKIITIVSNAKETHKRVKIKANVLPKSS